MHARWRIATPKAAVRAVIAITCATTALVGGTAIAASAAPAAGIYIGAGYIENQWSHRCLDERTQGNGADGTTVQIWECNGLRQQMWDFYRQPGGNGHTYYLVNWLSGKCLDADTNTINRNGTKIQVWDCNGWSNQNWDIPLVSGVPVHISSMWTGFPAFGSRADQLDQDLNDGKTTDGARVQLYSYMTSNVNQQWVVRLL